MTGSSATDRVRIFADGGSRGNPGPAGYGAVVFADDGHTVLAERAASLGRVTNNVAEYNGLIAGLQAAVDIGARRVVVRMDSKLVIEQMSGRWQVKHPDMKPLAAKASALVRQFSEVDFGWVPRSQNSHADRLANEAMDAAARGEVWSADGTKAPVAEVALDGLATAGVGESEDLLSLAAVAERSVAVDGEAGRFEAVPTASRSRRADPAALMPETAPEVVTTKIVVVRHGETEWGVVGRFAGRADIKLTAKGRSQAMSVGRRIAPLKPDLILTSPLRRCRDTAEAIAIAGKGERVLVEVSEGLVDGLLGDWTGLTPSLIARGWPDEFAAWKQSADVAPPGGETFNEIRARTSAVVDQTLRDRAGRTIVMVTHAATAKMIIAEALGVPSDVAYRLRVDNASMSAFTVSADGAFLVWAVNETGHLSL